MATSQLPILSLSGGLDDTSAPSELAPNACTLAENVEFIYSTLGERRSGCTAITGPSSFSSLDAVVWMYKHTPSNDPTEVQLWALAQNLTGASPSYQLAYRDATGWHDVTLSDAMDATVPNGHRMSAASLHGKLFLAYNSGVDRLHVWDGTSVRRCGLAEPSAPTATNSGSGTFAQPRYYRVRYTVQSGGETILRSEPSDVLTFSPSGSGSGAIITKPATISEGETHWELEASLDNANFYVLATTAVGTTTVTDTASFFTGYAAYDLSEDVGDYTLLPSAKYLSVDEDRLVLAGSWEDASMQSRVWWTPVAGATGVGNDERQELDTDPYLDLDGYDGGELTGISRSTDGYIYATKLSHIYKMVRQGQRTKAYTAFPVTKAIGALYGSLVSAIDQAGNPTLYFLDTKQGPYRYGSEGLQWCGRDIQTLWGTVNVNANVACHGVYDAKKRQLHYWLALDTASYPDSKIVLHVNKMRNTDEGARQGWTTVPSGDGIAAAHCSVMMASNVDSSADRSLVQSPFIGKASHAIHLCGTGTTDNGTSYRAKVRTKPFWPGNLLNQVEILSGVLLVSAESPTDASISVKAIRDFGLETKTVSTVINPTSTEEYVIKQLDDLSFAELYAVQLEIGDLETTFVASDWKANALILKMTTGQTA